MKHFKEGRGSATNASVWKLCHDDERDLYTAELRFIGYSGSSYDLYQINKEIYDTAGTFENDEYKSEELIRTGRRLYRSLDQQSGFPDTIIFDLDYDKICDWAETEDYLSDYLNKHPGMYEGVGPSILDSRAEKE